MRDRDSNLWRWMWEGNTVSATARSTNPVPMLPARHINCICTYLQRPLHMSPGGRSGFTWVKRKETRQLPTTDLREPWISSSVLKVSRPAAVGWKGKWNWGVRPLSGSSLSWPCLRTPWAGGEQRLRCQSLRTLQFPIPRGLFDKDFRSLTKHSVHSKTDPRGHLFFFFNFSSHV